VRLAKYTFPESEKLNYYLDQKLTTEEFNRLNFARNAANIDDLCAGSV
jgi:hypothetical protein